MNTRRPILAVCICVAGASASPFARADEIVLAAADGHSPGQRIADVTIRKIEGDNLFYAQSNGVDASRPLGRVLQIAMPADPNFTAGEGAYAGGNLPSAVDGYLKALRTNDAWKIRRAAPRLIEAAGVAKRFDAAVAGYVAYAKLDPAAAAGSKPALPERGSAFLDDAAKQLDAAVRAAATDPERQALLALALDVQLARADQTSAQAIADQLAKLAGANGPNDPALAALAANVRLSQARLAITAGRFADANAAIDTAAPQLTDPRQQAEALFIRAEAQAGLITPNDSNARLDAAAAFMRVVANASANDGEPFISDSMLRAATLLADAGDVAGAKALCTQLASEFPSASATTEAAALAKRLPQ